MQMFVFNSHQLNENAHTLGDVLLAVAAADTDTVDNVALLGLVAKTASLVGAGGAGCTVDDVQLAVLPAPASR